MDSRSFAFIRGRISSCANHPKFSPDMLSAYMDLNLTSTELAFRDQVRGWLHDNVPADWEKRRAEDEMLARFEFLRAWQKQVFQAGWAGIAWPKEYGGRGASLMEQVIFTEEMARAGAPPLANVLGLMLIGPTIIAFGTDAQKKRFLP